MGVCETVKSLAEAVAKAKALEKPRHRLLVEILRLMPLYRDIGDLSAWESAIHGALGQDDESEVGQLLWEVFEFGTYNMYGAFDAEGTAEVFRHLSQWMAQRGVTAPEPQGLTDW